MYAILARRRNFMELTNEQLLLILGGIAALLTALNGLMTTAGAAVGSWITARRAVKKEEVEYLRSQIREMREGFKQLAAENENLHKENIALREYIGELRLILRENGIDVPAFEDWQNGRD